MDDALEPSNSKQMKECSIFLEICADPQICYNKNYEGFSFRNFVGSHDTSSVTVLLY